MKRYLKMIRNIIFFLGIYLLMQMMGGMVFGIVYGVMNRNNDLSQFQNKMQKAIMSNMYIIVAASAIVTLFIYMLALRKKQQNLWQRCNFKKITLSSMWKIALVSVGMGAFSCAIVYFMSSRIESYQKVSDSLSGAQGSILSMLSILIIAPIFEEILFRGLIFNDLKKNVNIVVAIILQALIFATVHGNLLQGIYTFILGVVLCILYICTKSIWSNIIGHIVYNLCGTMVFPIALYYTSKFVFVYMGVGLIVAIIPLINIVKTYRNSKDLTIGL